jgi:hypothetical protein
MDNISPRFSVRQERQKFFLFFPVALQDLFFSFSSLSRATDLELLRWFSIGPHSPPN